MHRILPQQRRVVGLGAGTQRTGLQKLGAALSQLQGPTGFSGTELAFSSLYEACLLSDSCSVAVLSSAGKGRELVSWFPKTWRCLGGTWRRVTLLPVGGVNLDSGLILRAAVRTGHILGDSGRRPCITLRAGSSSLDGRTDKPQFSVNTQGFSVGRHACSHSLLKGGD